MSPARSPGLRRQRGRRGMEVLAELQKLPNILVRISDINAEGVREVDDKLVVLARQLQKSQPTSASFYCNEALRLSPGHADARAILDTLGKSGTIHDRRLASARLLQQESAVKILFDEIAPAQKTRNGGYTRVVQMPPRRGDAAPGCPSSPRSKAFTPR